MYGFSQKCKPTAPNAETRQFGTQIEGSTMTVPNLAPSLKELIAASLHGEGFPMCGEPRYDDSEAQGIARSEVPGTITEIESVRYSEDFRKPQGVPDSVPSDEDKRPLASADEEVKAPDGGTPEN